MAAGLAIAIGTAGPAPAASDMHRHGAGQLDIVIEADAVMIEVQIPAADVVGFENEPRTPEEESAVRKARETLELGDRLFDFPAGAHCRLETAEVDRRAIDGQRAAVKDTHGDFDARYLFRCERPSRVSRIDVQIFEHFPAVRELQARIISPDGQTAYELDRSSTRLSF